MLHLKLFFLCVTFTVVTCKEFTYEYGLDNYYYVTLGRTSGHFKPFHTTTTVDLTPLAHPTLIHKVKVTIYGLTDLDTPESVSYDAANGIVTINYSFLVSMTAHRRFTIEIRGPRYHLDNAYPLSRRSNSATGQAIVEHSNSTSSS